MEQNCDMSEVCDYHLRVCSLPRLVSANLAMKRCAGQYNTGVCVCMCVSGKKNINRKQKYVKMNTGFQQLSSSCYQDCATKDEAQEEITEESQCTIALDSSAAVTVQSINERKSKINTNLCAQFLFFKVIRHIYCTFIPLWKKEQFKENIKRPKLPPRSRP